MNLLQLVNTFSSTHDSSSDFLSKLFLGEHAQNSLQLVVRPLLAASLPSLSFPNDHNTNGVKLEMK